MNNPIPGHLRPYIAEAIKAGHRTPDGILNAAIDRCNSVVNEMCDGKSRRSQIVSNQLMADVWQEHTR